MFELVIALLNVIDTAVGGTATEETDDDTEETDGVLLVGDDINSDDPLNFAPAGILFMGQLLLKLNSVVFPTMVEAADIVDECDSEDGKLLIQDSGANAPESLSPILKLVAIVILLFTMGLSLDLINDKGVSVVELEEVEGSLGILVSRDLFSLFEIESNF